MKKLYEYLETLVACPSITPEDAGAQNLIKQILVRLGFQVEQMDNGPVSNLFAIYGQNDGPILMFAGHTDVVSPGPLESWKTPPFELTEDHGFLYGRGVADMKGSLAAMLCMAESFVRLHPNPKGRLAFLITSGEEGDDFHLGTPYVMERILARNLIPQYCIVGEPSSEKILGDVIKVGRRGSLSGHMTLSGIQGHVAYPHLASNPIHKVLGALNELCQTTWDQGSEHFPPTSFQITQIHAGGQASNIIPGSLDLAFNFRFSTHYHASDLIAKVEECFERHDLIPELHWRINGEPFLTSKGKLLDTLIQAVKENTNQTPNCSTSGGTSDGRFIAPYGVEVIEFGPPNLTIHKVNECVKLEDLINLSKVYLAVAQSLLTSK